jgi:hypothetical protein
MLEAQIGELLARIAGGNSAVFSLIQIVCHALETRGVVTQAEIAEAVSRCANITVPDAKDRAQVIGQALLTGSRCNWAALKRTCNRAKPLRLSLLRAPTRKGF